MYAAAKLPPPRDLSPKQMIPGRPLLSETVRDLKKPWPGIP